MEPKYAGARMIKRRIERAYKRSVAADARKAKEPRYDVLIVEIKTKRVEAVTAFRLNHRRAVGFFGLMMDRVKDEFLPVLVPHGQYKKGDTWKSSKDKRK